MLAFEELSKEMQGKVLDKKLSNLLDMIVEGTVEITLSDKSKNRLMQRILTHTRKQDLGSLAKTELLKDKGIKQELLNTVMFSLCMSSFDQMGNEFLDDWRTA